MISTPLTDGRGKGLQGRRTDGGGSVVGETLAELDESHGVGGPGNGARNATQLGQLSLGGKLVMQVSIVASGGRAAHLLGSRDFLNAGRDGQLLVQRLLLVQMRFMGGHMGSGDLHDIGGVGGVHGAATGRREILLLRQPTDLHDGVEGSRLEWRKGREGEGEEATGGADERRL